MKNTEAAKYDLNSEPINSFFKRVISDFIGYAQLNIDEQELINKYSTWHGKHPLEFTKHSVLDYHKDLVSPQEMKQILMFPFPGKSPESPEEMQKYEDDMKMINSEPIKSFFELVINDVSGFIEFIMDQNKTIAGQHPASLLIKFLKSYQKDITFSPKL